MSDLENPSRKSDEASPERGRVAAAVWGRGKARSKGAAGAGSPEVALPDRVAHGTIPTIGSDPEREVRDLYHEIENTRGDWAKSH